MTTTTPVLAATDTPAGTVDRFRMLTFESYADVRAGKHLHKSREPFVPVALGIIPPAAFAVLAERKLKHVIAIAGIDWNYQSTAGSGESPNFVIVYSDNTTRDIITRYPQIKAALNFNAADDSLMSRKTAYRIEDGAIVENPCIFFTRWKTYRGSRTFLIVSTKQSRTAFIGCLFKSILSHLGLAHNTLTAENGLVSQPDGRLGPIWESALRRLYNDAFKPGMTEEQALETWKLLERTRKTP